MRVRTLVDNLNYIELVNAEYLSGEIMGISYNSKKTQPNDVFICIPHTQGQPKDVLFLNVLLCAQ